MEIWLHGRATEPPGRRELGMLGMVHLSCQVRDRSWKYSPSQVKGCAIILHEVPGMYTYLSWVFEAPAPLALQHIYARSNTPPSADTNN